MCCRCVYCQCTGASMFCLVHYSRMVLKRWLYCSVLVKHIAIKIPPSLHRWDVEISSGSCMTIATCVTDVVLTFPIRKVEE